MNKEAPKHRPSGHMFLACGVSEKGGVSVLSLGIILRLYYSITLRKYVKCCFVMGLRDYRYRVLGFSTLSHKPETAFGFEGLGFKEFLT